MLESDQHHIILAAVRERNGGAESEPRTRLANGWPDGRLEWSATRLVSQLRLFASQATHLPRGSKHADPTRHEDANRPLKDLYVPLLVRL